MLVERLREVRALLAFTRIESKGDFADAAYVDDGRETPLSRQSPTWLPASEVRGEGLFLRLKESALQQWENRAEVLALEREFFDAHKEWRRLRREPPEAGFPGSDLFFCIRSRMLSCARSPWSAVTPRPVSASGFTVGLPPRNMVRWRAS